MTAAAVVVRAAALVRPARALRAVALPAAAPVNIVVHRKAVVRRSVGRAADR
jgi:hypothetical protein